MYNALPRVEITTCRHSYRKGRPQPGESDAMPDAGIVNADRHRLQSAAAIDRVDELVGADERDGDAVGLLTEPDGRPAADLAKMASRRCRS